MRESFSRFTAFLFAFSVLLFTSCQSTDPSTLSADSKRGMVATVHPLATEAGLRAMKEGGNAVDAAIAAALTLGVVDGHNSGVGGGCFMLIRRPDGTVLAIDGREVAPAAATRDMYLQDGVPQPVWSKHGVLAVGVPGALAAYAKAVEKTGNLSLGEHLEYAAQIAESGFVIDHNYAQKLNRTGQLLKRDPASAKVFFDASGELLTEGQLLVQLDLAKSYRQIATQGIGWFYGGEFAELMEDWMAEQGGIIVREDLADYRVKMREPIRSTYHDYEIIGFPPPSSGGIHVAQILNIVEQFDLPSLRQENPALAVHVLVEAMKLAFADRAYWLGDPGYADVPKGLISKEYAGNLAGKIDLSKASSFTAHDLPPGWESDHFMKHTTHIATADSEGNWVAITTTVNTTFGAKVMVPGTGVILNNEMDDFSIRPGQPNAFGLVGAEANAIEPGKRPLSSMSPTIVLKDGLPILTLGAAGGPTIITQVVNSLVRRLDFDFTLEGALAAPRFHHQWRPDQLFVERTLDESIGKQLVQLGHRIKTRDFVGVTQAIEWDTENQRFIGVSDPRIPGKAAGF